MILNIFFIFLGLVLVVFGADFLVEGSSSVARKFKIDEFVIGLTIVGFGTSCPELVVSTMGALCGSSDIAIGNVIGSNIFNTLLILGVTAVIMPITITTRNISRDIPVTLAATLIFLLLGLHQGDIGKIDAVIMLVLFALYLFLCFKSRTDDLDEENPAKVFSSGISVLYILGGLAALVYGGHLFVDSSVTIARSLGISEKFIAITLLAGGTSLPELATSIVAAAKGKGQLALGNILGSNVFNILLILGIAALIKPVSMANIDWVDIAVLLTSILVILISSLISKRKILGRTEGIILLLIFLLYYIWLFINL